MHALHSAVQVRMRYNLLIRHDSSQVQSQAILAKAVKTVCVLSQRSKGLCGVWEAKGWTKGQQHCDGIRLIRPVAACDQHLPASASSFGFHGFRANAAQASF